MTEKEKRELYAPRWWDLFENGEFIDSFPSHAAAKKAKHLKIKEAYANCLDLDYEIRPQEYTKPNFNK